MSLFYFYPFSSRYRVDRCYDDIKSSQGVLDRMRGFRVNSSHVSLHVDLEDFVMTGSGSFIHHHIWS